MSVPGLNQVPMFRLYGLIGCPHCLEAESFLRNRQVPFLVNLGNGDPIIAAGIKEITKQEGYPVLVVTFTNPIEIITGYKQEDYDRLARLYHQLAGAGAFAVPDSGQQAQPQAAGESTPPTPPTGVA